VQFLRIPIAATIRSPATLASLMQRRIQKAAASYPAYGGVPIASGGAARRNHDPPNGAQSALVGRIVR